MKYWATLDFKEGNNVEAFVFCNRSERSRERNMTCLVENRSVKVTGNWGVSCLVLGIMTSYIEQLGRVGAF